MIPPGQDVFSIAEWIVIPGGALVLLTVFVIKLIKREIER